MSLDMRYARWILTAKLGNVRLSAVSLQDSHKEATLRQWKKMHAKEIAITACPDALPMNRYLMTYTVKYEPLTCVVVARNEQAARDRLWCLKSWHRVISVSLLGTAE